MSKQETIKRAIYECEQAEHFSRQATQLYYSARQRLKGLISSTAPEKGLKPEDVSRLLIKRHKTILKS